MQKQVALDVKNKRKGMIEVRGSSYLITTVPLKMRLSLNGEI